MGFIKRWLIATRLIQIMKVEPGKKYVLFISREALTKKDAADLAAYLWKECFDATIVITQSPDPVSILEMNEKQ